MWLPCPLAVVTAIARLNCCIMIRYAPPFLSVLSSGDIVSQSCPTDASFANFWIVLSKSSFISPNPAMHNGITPFV